MHFGTILVSSSVTDAEIILDGGEPRSLPLTEPLLLSPGKHQFVVRAPAHADAVKELDVEGGVTVELSLDPEPLSKPRAVVERPRPKPAVIVKKEQADGGWFPAQRPVGYTAIGTGVALGGAAIVTALVAADLRARVADDVAAHEAYYGQGCARGDPRVCAYDIEVTNHDADRADGLRDASVWMGIGAGVLTAGGVVLVLFAGHGARKRGEAGEPLRQLACAGRIGGVACAGSF
jgi:hypothetical protein